MFFKYFYLLLLSSPIQNTDTVGRPNVALMALNNFFILVYMLGAITFTNLDCSERSYNSPEGTIWLMAHIGGSAGVIHFHSNDEAEV